jgi:hypothetical protein
MSLAFSPKRIIAYYPMVAEPRNSIDLNQTHIQSALHPEYHQASQKRSRDLFILPCLPKIF